MAKHTTQEIIAAVQAAGFKLIDDHGYGRNVESISAVGVHHRGNRQQVVALYEHVAYFSVNEIYLDEKGVPHLSTSSVGGIIKPYGDIEQGVIDYNEGQKNNPLSPGFIDTLVKRVA